ncbi:hypothetical protein NQ315_007208 [Exocentrus adspersus]|uniref:Molybdopterin synthase sulfur carrier subunit n=1 Tax=Exocentrus adspersus TaxID=1586481 RepID=A0AAV8WDY7_9CUCU|nr:hypothetical protein NQ315_007208 [Exocentrus adspersus]
MSSCTSCDLNLMTPFLNAAFGPALKNDNMKSKDFDVFVVSSPIPYNLLLEKIVTTFSLESIQNNIILALNEQYCDSNTIITLKPGDELAVIPPLSGG